MPQWLPSNFSSLGSVFRNSETGSCFSWLLKFSLIWQSTPVTASKSYRKKANEQITSCLFLGCCSHLCGISNGFYTSFSILLTMEYKAFLLPPPPLRKQLSRSYFFMGSACQFPMNWCLISFWQKELMQKLWCGELTLAVNVPLGYCQRTSMK